MQHEQIRTLFEYHWATTKRLFEHAGQLEQATYLAEIEYGHGSIHKLLFHILAADHGWRLGLETGEQQSGLSQDEYPNIGSLTSLLANETRAWDAYLNRLSEADLQQEITLKTLRGQTRTFPLWRILIHLVLHGMQHHSELSHMLSEHKLSPGNIDFIFYTE